MVWSDAINYERIKNGGADGWEIMTFSYMSFFVGLNFAAIISLIHFLTGIPLDKFTINFGTMFTGAISSLLWSIVNLYIPAMLLNFFLVFYKKRYEHILRVYSFQNGKILVIYLCLSIVAYFGISIVNKFL